MNSFHLGLLSLRAFLLLPAFSFFAVPSLAEDGAIVDLTLAAGAGYAPDYEGSDDYEFGLVPFAELSIYDGLASLSVEGLQAALPLGEMAAVGVGLGYDGGRDENENEALEDLGDVNGTVLGSVSAILALGEIGLDLTFSHAFGGGHEGYTINLTVSHGIQVIEGAFDLEFGAGVTWASQNYMDAFFGIDAAQAVASGLDETEVDAGFKNAGVQAGGNFYLNDRLTLGAILDYQRLLGEAADSPIVKDEGRPDQFSAIAYLAIDFVLF